MHVDPLQIKARHNSSLDAMYPLKPLTNSAYQEYRKIFVKIYSKERWGYLDPPLIEQTKAACGYIAVWEDCPKITVFKAP